MQQMGRQVDVRTFLLRLDDAGIGGPPGHQISEWHRHGVGEEMSEVDFQMGERAERPEVGFLIPGTFGGAWPGGHFGGEILNALN